MLLKNTEGTDALLAFPVAKLVPRGNRRFIAHTNEQSYHIHIMTDGTIATSITGRKHHVRNR